MAGEAKFQSLGKYSSKSQAVLTPSCSKTAALAGPTPFKYCTGIEGSILFCGFLSDCIICPFAAFYHDVPQLRA
jgi:hypothetical protein